MISLVRKGVSGYRPVYLISCRSKMLERIVSSKLCYLLSVNPFSNLYEFIKGKGVADCIMTCLQSPNDACRVFAGPQRYL